MTYRVVLSDLGGMTERERKAELAALVARAKSSGDEAHRTLDSRIRSYELHYEMSSRELLEKLAREEVKETADVSRWLFLLSARDCRVTQ